MIGPSESLKSRMLGRLRKKTRVNIDAPTESDSPSMESPIGPSPSFNPVRPRPMQRMGGMLSVKGTRRPARRFGLLRRSGLF